MYGPDGDDWNPEDLFHQYGDQAVEFQTAKWGLPRDWRSGDRPQPPRSVEELAELTGMDISQTLAFDAELTGKLQSDAKFVGDLEFFRWSLDEAERRWGRDYG
jgi:hypothetical protein